MSAIPVVNITMPVFNRYEVTQAAILALRKTSQEIPFCLTVVDNGSDAPLVRKLIDFKERGIIDYLFLLPTNMGVACAANIGWQLVDAPIYMKLDNEIVITEPHWLKKLFCLWRHGQPLSTLGGAFNRKMLLKHPGALRTRDGILGICRTNLAGQTILIPKEVSDILGRWNEDYGLYGTEDGDYGARMIAAGFPQYYYHGPDFFHDLGKSDNTETYFTRNVDKGKEAQEAWETADGKLGLFVTSATLYDECIRPFKIMPRYAVVDITNDYYVHVIEREEYKQFRPVLEGIAQLFTELINKRTLNQRFDPELVLRMKKSLARFGQSSDDMERAALAAERKGIQFFAGTEH